MENLEYNKRLKRIPMMIRRNNVAIRESSDNIDHKIVVITWQLRDNIHITKLCIFTIFWFTYSYQNFYITVLLRSNVDKPK